jgi:DNA-binding NtrC family response regulator
MIVDDEENILHSLRRVLSKTKNLDIVTCDSPFKALEIAADSDFQLFISDYRMPGMDGVEFLTATRKHHPEAMRLVLSGTADFDALVSAINKAEIYRFISKPVQSYELISTVEQALHIFDLSRENRILADRVREQGKELDRRETALRKLADEHPVIAEVNWGPDGSIILDEEEI